MTEPHVAHQEEFKAFIGGAHYRMEQTEREVIEWPRVEKLINEAYTMGLRHMTETAEIDLQREIEDGRLIRKNTGGWQ